MSDRTVRVWLEMITSRYHASLDRAGVSTKGLANQVDDLGKRGTQRINDLSSGFVNLSGKSALAAGGIAIAGAATITWLNNSIDRYTELVSKVDQYQDVTGASAEESSRMVAVAEAFGVSTDSLANAMFRLARNVETNKDGLREYGIQIARNADGSIDLTATLGNVAEAYQRVGGGQEGARIAQEAFGRGGNALIDILERERSEIEAVTAAAIEHGQIFSDADIAAVREYNVAMEELSQAWGEFGRSAATTVVPILTDIAEGLSDVQEVIEDIVGVLPDIGPQIRDAFTDAIPGAGGSWVESASNMNPLTSALYDFVAGGDEAASTGEDLTTIGEAWERSLREQDAAIEEVVEETQSLNEQMQELLATAFGVSGAQDRLTGSVLDFVRSVRDAKADGNEFATSLESTSIEGVKNRQMLQGLAEDAVALAGEMAAIGEDPVAAMASVRQQLIDTAVELGFDRTEAEALFDVLLQVGELTVQPKVDLDTDPAWAKIKALTDFFGWHPFGLGLGGWDWESAEAPDVTGGVGNVTSGRSGGRGGESAKERAEREAREREQAEADFDRAMGARFEFGGLSVEEYKAYLEARIAATEAYSAEWVGLMNELDAVNKKIGQGWTDAAEHQQEIEDNMFEVGAMSTDQYLAILQERLKGLEEFSDEWTAVWQQIQDVEEQASQHLLDLIGAVEQERQYWQTFMAEQDQRNLQMLREAPVGPVVVQGGSTTTLSMSATVAGSGSTAGDLKTANQSMRDQAFLLGV